MKKKVLLKKLIPNEEERQKFSQKMEVDLFLKATERWMVALEQYDKSGELSGFVDANNQLDAVNLRFKKKRISAINRNNRAGAYKNNVTKEMLLMYQDNYIAKNGRPRGWITAACIEFKITSPTLKRILNRIEK